MKNLSSLLGITVILGIILSCENNNPAGADSVGSQTNIKTITATDASGQYVVKLKISAADPAILRTYNDKSFTLSFEGPTKPGSAEEKAANIAIEKAENTDGIENVVDIEIVPITLPGNAAGMALSYQNSSSLRTTAARMVTVNLYASSPLNYIWVYNKSTSGMKVEFASKKTSSSAFVIATTKTLNPRGEAGYCKKSVAQLRATLTYDANAGSYSYITWNYNTCP